MAAVSYVVTVGNTLEQVTAGTSAPAATGTIEIRIDQTASIVTDGAFAGSTRAVSKQDVFVALELIKQYLERDPNVFQQ